MHLRDLPKKNELDWFKVCVTDCRQFFSKMDSHLTITKAGLKFDPGGFIVFVK